MTGERHASFAEAGDMTLPQLWNLSRSGQAGGRRHGSLGDLAAERRRRERRSE